MLISSIISLFEYNIDPRFLARMDCSQFSYDYEVLSSFGFRIDINPLVATSLNTYARMDENENVYYLNVAYQSALPTTVFCLKFLRELYVRNTYFYETDSDDESIRRVPSQIELLASSLVYFAVYDTTITHLPEQIGRLNYLYRLELLNTGLITLPDSINNLSSLSHLYLSNNHLTSLPTTMANMRLLYNVRLDNNPKLRSIQALNGLSSVYSLHAPNCAIERLPLNLPNLYTLDLSYNNLTDLINIGTLGNTSIGIKIFSFQRNSIRYIPSQIRSVRNLFDLNLDTNELTTLPVDLFNMTSLRYLYIRNNLFTGAELKAIVSRFNQTNPTMNLYWT